MTIREALLGISAYPIPAVTVEAIALRRAISLDSVADFGTLEGFEFKLAKADLCKWLYTAPTVSQGGQSYSLSSDQREFYKKQAEAIYESLGQTEDLSTLKSKYGYMGSRL